MFHMYTTTTTTPITTDGQTVKQLFLWSLNGGLAAAPAARATRVTLYGSYKDKAAITSYWCARMICVCLGVSLQGGWPHDPS
jgi:hypothetical protein